MNDDSASLKRRFTPQEGKPVKLDRQLSAAQFEAADEALPELKPLVGPSGWVQHRLPLIGVGIAVRGLREHSASSGAW